MKFLINGVTDDATINDAEYYFIASSRGQDGDATETNRDTPVIKAMTLRAMVIRGVTAPGVGETQTMTVYKNGSATACTVDITDTNVQATVTGLSVDFAAGDTISIRYDESATAADPDGISWSILTESVTTDYFVVFGATEAAPSNVSTVYNNLQGGDAAWELDIESVDQPMPLAGTMTDLAVALTSVPGAGNQWDFVAMLDAGTTALAINFGAAESGIKTITGQSVAITAGQMVAMRAIGTSIPTASQVSWSCAITPTTPGQSAIMFGLADSPSNLSTEYAQLQGSGSETWTTTEANHQVVLYATTIQAMYADIETAPGAGNDWDLWVREEGANMTGVTLNIGEAATTGSVTGLSAAVTTGNRYNYACIPTSTPMGTGKGFHIGIQIFFAVGIAFDAATNSGYQAAASTYNWAHTCTGSDRYLTVGIAMLSLAQTVSSITYNSVALTLLGVRSSVTGACRIELWGLVAPDTGSNTIEVTLTGAIASAGVASSYTGIHQTSPYEAFNSAQATNVGAADATVDITTVADNDWVVDIVATDDTAITVGAGQTSRGNVSGAGGSGAMSSEGPKTPAGAVTMSWTNVAALATWAIGGIALRPIAAANLGVGSRNTNLSLMGVGS